MRNASSRWCGAVCGAASACVLALAGCGDPSPPPPPPPATAEPPPKPETRKGPSLFDREGRLRESDEEVAGLRLPVGLTRDPHTEMRHHVYRSSHVPLEKIIAYFGPRLFTGSVRRVGAGIVYERAVPMAHRESKVPLDVAISKVGPAEVKVTLDEYSPPPSSPPQVNELQKNLLREQKQIE